MFAVVNTLTCLQLVFGTIVSTTDTLNSWDKLPTMGSAGNFEARSWGRRLWINVRFVGCLPGHFSNENNSQLSDIVWPNLWNCLTNCTLWLDIMSEHKNDLLTFWLQRSPSQSKFALKHVNDTESLLLFVLPLQISINNLICTISLHWLNWSHQIICVCILLVCS